MASRSSVAANTRKARLMSAREAADRANDKSAFELRQGDWYISPWYGAPIDVCKNWVRRQAYNPYKPSALEEWGLALARELGVI